MVNTKPGCLSAGDTISVPSPQRRKALTFLSPCVRMISIPVYHVTSYHKVWNVGAVRLYCCINRGSSYAVVSQKYIVTGTAVLPYRYRLPPIWSAPHDLCAVDDQFRGGKRSRNPGRNCTEQTITEYNQFSRATHTQQTTATNRAGNPKHVKCAPHTQTLSTHCCPFSPSAPT